MAAFISLDRCRFLLNRFRERLWVRPMGVCLLSVAAAFVAGFADGTRLAEIVPRVTADSVETLLSIMAASMLVIATFSVGAMVSSYASASRAATPRAFNVLVADDVSQNALSTFVGAFIFSIVAIAALKNRYFDVAGLFILFALVLAVFAIVILTFVRWVDHIARLGRMGSIIKKVEKATAKAIKQRRGANLCGIAPQGPPSGQALYAEEAGYVQHIDMAALQAWSKKNQARVRVAALPGTLAAPGRALAYVESKTGNMSDLDCGGVIGAFQIGADRFFDDDPRFGLVVLSQIACRALSPAVNDPGTAIDIIGALIRLFVLWHSPMADEETSDTKFDQVEVPEISLEEMFDDAFTSISRDGAGLVEVSVRLQKALQALAINGEGEMREIAEHHSRLALKRSKHALSLAEDLQTVEKAAGFSVKDLT